MRPTTTDETRPRLVQRKFRLERVDTPHFSGPGCWGWAPTGWNSRTGTARAALFQRSCLLPDVLMTHRFSDEAGVTETPQNER